MPRCIVETCNVEDLRSIKALFLHIQLYHEINLKAKITCLEYQCLRDFNGWPSFRRHLISFHKFRKVTSNYHRRVQRSDNNENVPSTNDENDFDIDERISDNENCKSYENTLECIQDLAFSFVAKFYSNPNLSRSIVQDIIDSTHDFLDNVVSSVNSSIIFYLKSKSVDLKIL